MKRLRFILFPMAGIYHLITLSRNKLFDLNILKSKSYPIPVICIGNLTTGGTGKSPMTEYIVRLLSKKYRVATLSRGYGRKTFGYLDVTPTHLATEVGDEPLQFARKFNEVQVAVCEDRQTGIETLLAKESPPEVIILDDAFQHRKVRAGLSILLTAHNNLYSSDYLLPVGNLRESRSGADRADLVVVTKCPDGLSQDQSNHIASKLKLKDQQELFFSKITYNENIYSEHGPSSLETLKDKTTTVVTGIANPQPFLEFLNEEGLSYKHKSFKDHHNFTTVEVAALQELDCILTTEKDYVRLRPLLHMKELYYLPIKASFTRNENVFNSKIEEFVSSFKA